MNPQNRFVVLGDAAIIQEILLNKLTVIILLLNIDCFLIFVINEQFRKQLNIIVITEFGSVIVDNPEQPEKHALPSIITEFGISMVCNLEHPEKQ